MSYEEDVSRAAECLETGEEANWKLAELTHRNTQHKKGARYGVTMDAWCEAVRSKKGGRLRFSASTGRIFRAVWEKYGSVYSRGDASGTLSWTEAIGMVDPGGHDPVIVHSRQGAYYLRQGPKEIKVKAVAELLEDIDILEASDQEDSPVAKALDVIHERRERKRQERLREVAQIPAVREIDQQMALSALIHTVSHFASETQRLMGEIAGLPDHDHDAWMSNAFLRDAYTRAQVAMETLKGLLDTGVPRKDVDDFFKSVVGKS
jgi:hypothetical protein